MFRCCSLETSHPRLLSVVYFIFFFSYSSCGSQGRNTEVVCHSLLEWTTFHQNSPPWPRGEGDDRKLDGWMVSVDSLDMSLSKLRELLMDREAWHAAFYGVKRSLVQSYEWVTELNCEFLTFSFACKVFLWFHISLSYYYNCPFFPGCRAIVLLFFFPFIFISWRLFTLQYFSGFCHTLNWISHGFACIPHPDPPSHLPLDPIPLGLPSAPGPSTCLMHPAWAADLFHHRWYTSFRAVLSKHPTLAFAHRVQKSVLYICISLSVLHIGLSLPSF